jgi:hypothetical protein
MTLSVDPWSVVRSLRLTRDKRTGTKDEALGGLLKNYPERATRLFQQAAGLA